MATPRKSTAVATRKTPARTNRRTTPKKAKGGVFTDAEGEEFHLSGKINTFLLLKLQADQEDGEFNGADIYRLIIGMVTDADRSRFISKLSRNSDFDATKLNTVMTQMLEVASGANPSTSQSDSGGTAKRNTSRALSAAS